MIFTEDRAKAIDPHDYLQEARRFQRIAGMWAFWSDKLSASGKSYIWCSRIEHKQKHFIVTETHSRVPIDRVWVLPAFYDFDRHWPKTGWDMFQPLALSDAKKAMQAAITEMALGEEGS